MTANSGLASACGKSMGRKKPWKDASTTLGPCVPCAGTSAGHVCADGVKLAVSLLFGCHASCAGHFGALTLCRSRLHSEAYRAGARGGGRDGQLRRVTSRDQRCAAGGAPCGVRLRSFALRRQLQAEQLIRVSCVLRQKCCASGQNCLCAPRSGQRRQATMVLARR